MKKSDFCRAFCLMLMYSVHLHHLMTVCHDCRLVMSNVVLSSTWLLLLYHPQNQKPRFMVGQCSTVQFCWAGLSYRITLQFKDYIKCYFV